MEYAIAAASAAAGVYLLLAILLFLMQRRLLYRPYSLRISPIRAGLPLRVTENEFNSFDGTKLICWDLPAAPGQPTLLYFHGNGGGLAERRDSFLRCASAGIGLFMMSYRGYSGSTGSPNEKAIIADALTVFDTLQRSRGPIVLYGESLGSGVAVQVAAQRMPRAVILEAPYTSITDVAQSLYRILPVRPFLLDRFESVKYIGKLRAPLLVIHGDRDGTIPVRLGKSLFEAAPEPKTLAILPGAGHNDLYLHGAWDIVLRFLTDNLRLRLI
jgi:fermentation-respiration switch protein FrsA (DUF1100 family)